MLIIGSKAFNYNFPNQGRQYKDVDIIAYRKDVEYLIENLSPQRVVDNKGLVSLKGITRTEIYDRDQVEVLIADDSKALRSYLDHCDANDYLKYATPEVLFSCKKSHIHFPIFFEKHIKDYTFLYDYFKGVDKLKDITKEHFKEIEVRRGKLKTPSLNKGKDNFFEQSNDFVKSYFVHDHIHEAVAHYDAPLYTRMQRDQSLARCEKNMWENFTFEDKCKCVLEEAYVIALERKVLPALYGGKKWFTSEECLNWALYRICTTLCSGWFRSFATDNYFRIKEFVNNYYVEDFLQKVQDGKIIKIDSCLG
jgi:hypothetical protein